MKNTFKISALIAALVLANPAFAQSPTDALATCLVDNLTGKERKSLAKWIFFAIGAHPEIKAYSNVSPKDVRASDEYVGALVTRLMTVDCATRLKTAYAADPGSLQKAFEMVGRVAIQELTTSEEVQKAISSHAQYADKDKINKLLTQK